MPSTHTELTEREPVKRYEYDAENEHMEPELFGTNISMVLASDYDSLAAKLKALPLALSEAVAERIFEIGREGEYPCHRIEFKVYIDCKEVGVGGLAREPFTRYAREAIKAALSRGDV